MVVGTKKSKILESRYFDAGRWSGYGSVRTKQSGCKIRSWREMAMINVPGAARCALRRIGELR